MRIVWQLITALVMACLLSQCTMTPDQQYIREKIPIEIQSGKPLIVNIRSLSGNGWNEVGIRCSPDVWKALMAVTNSVAVRLISSSKTNTSIINVFPGSHRLWPLDSFYYLFSIGGDYRANATVEITFPSAPEGVTQAEIIVLITPADGGP
jgi:hypothetical protein